MNGPDPGTLPLESEATGRPLEPDGFEFDDELARALRLLVEAAFDVLELVLAEWFSRRRPS